MPAPGHPLLLPTSARFVSYFPYGTHNNCAHHVDGVHDCVYLVLREIALLLSVVYAFSVVHYIVRLFTITPDELRVILCEVAKTRIQDTREYYTEISANMIFMLFISCMCTSKSHKSNVALNSAAQSPRR